jgi:chaperonin cofactor prefoldin
MGCNDDPDIKMLMSKVEERLLRLEGKTETIEGRLNKLEGWTLKIEKRLSRLQGEMKVVLTMLTATISILIAILSKV